MTPFRASLKEIWSRLTWPDLVSTMVVAGGLLASIFAFNGGFFSFLKYLAVLAGLYLMFRLIGWWRNRLLWSLRNRLIVAYLFIAAVPILSIVTLAVLAARILYSQLGAYLLYEDIHQRIEMTADIAEHIAIAHQTLPSTVTEAESERILAAQSHAVHDRELPGLSIAFSNDQTLSRKLIPAGKRSFAGMLQEGDKLFIASLRVIPDRKGERVVTLRVPVTPEFLSTVAPDLGSIQLNLMERYLGGAQPGLKYRSGDTEYVVARPIVASNRTLQAAMFWIDSQVDVVSRLDSAYVGPDGRVEPVRPVFAASNARPSRLNGRIFTSLGELRDSYVKFFILLGIIFALVEAAAFPSTLPSVPGVEIEAICKAARSVSGDYYDFIQLSPTHIAIAIADISGKGISAALLMASLQAALRSQLLVEGSERLSMIELVSRLNKHLVRNTGDDRFATFFIAVYDSATRTLRYTNAGHLPAFLVCSGASQQLDKGGMVLGVMEDYVYEEGSLTVAPNALLIGYSDGLIEPENVYGEEFGIRRLQEAANRVQAAAPLMVAESLMAAAEEWAGTPEQADDMTVIVARLR